MLVDWLDNPIFIKHVRSRLRRQSTTASIFIVFLTCLCILYAGYQFGFLYSGGYFAAIFIFQSIILVGAGSSRMAELVLKSRFSGILAFHRLSPLTPTELTLGFFFSAPVREYLLAACTLPFAALAVSFESPDFRGFAQMMILLLLTSWVIHGFTLLNALVSKSQTAALPLVGCVILIGGLGGISIRSLNQIGRLAEEDLHLDFFGVPLPWLGFALIDFIAILVITFLAARRKMESERLHALSKPQALGAAAVLGVLVLGGVGNVTNPIVRAVAVLYILVVAGVVLTSVVTPSRNEYIRGLLRSRRLEIAEPSCWHDHALNRPFLACLCAVVLVVGTIVSNTAQAQPGSGMASLAIAHAVLTVGYYGLGIQFFRLRFGKRGMGYFMVFLFFAWLAPLLAGLITLVSNPMQLAVAQALFALSPIGGIGLLASRSITEGHLLTESAAITSSLFFLFVFNSLVGSAKRRVRRWVMKAAQPAPSKPKEVDELASPLLA